MDVAGIFDRSRDLGIGVKGENWDDVINNRATASIIAGNFGVNYAREFEDVSYHVFRLVWVRTDADGRVLPAGDGGFGDVYSISDFFGRIGGDNAGRFVNSNPFCDFVASGYGRKIGGVIFADHTVG